ncbi:2OG-Fe(II) oxygenase [Luteimonas sp. A649]
MTQSATADFIEVTPGALDAATCAAIVERMRASDALQPGRVGSGVFPELKNSRDIALSGRADWADVEQALNVAVYRGLLAYIRRWPQVLIAPLMLQQPGADGALRRLRADDISAMDDRALGQLAMACLRPGSVNLQWYAAGQGGYPYWHCELYPRDPQAETLHRHLLWTVYLNDGFEAGETEFMFQQRKIKPRVGDLLIAPTAFTHTHRGNRPEGGDKFIATSWILFHRAETLFPAT